MNFSARFLVLSFAMILGGCGVKSPPLPYPETSIDSYIQNYTGKAPSPETSPTPSAEEKPAPKP